MELIATMAATAGTEALKSWGVFSLLLMGLAIMFYLSERRSRALDQENKDLRGEVARLQDLRLQDAREMIRVAETGTATMAARAEGDARFRDLMTALVTRVSQLDVAGPAGRSARLPSPDRPETP